MTRVTQSMLSTNMLRNLNSSYSKMSKYQDMINSGMKITRASDDPVVAVKAMDYRVQLDKISQYQRNMNEADAWLDTTDTSLDQVGNVLNRVKELVVQAANDSNTPDDRAKIQKEINQIREQLKDIGNTQLSGKYVFSGTHTQKPLYVHAEIPDVEKFYSSLTDTEKVDFLAEPDATKEQFMIDHATAAGVDLPKKTVRVENTDAGLAAKYPSEVFVVTDVTDSSKTMAIPAFDLTITKLPGSNNSMSTHGINGNVNVEVFDSIELTVNTNGAPEIFAAMEKVLKNVSDVLADSTKGNTEISAALGSGPNSVTENIATLQAKVLDARADVGARMNRVELMKNRLDIQEVNITKQKSLNEDTDYAETITKMTNQEAIHQAALSVGAKIIQQTLIDFMR